MPSSALKATFFGPDNDFFMTAFYSPTFPPVADVNVLSFSSTQIVVQQPTTGAITTFTGVSLTVNSLGDVTGGSFTGISFVQGGTTVATMSNFNWDAVAFEAAVVGLETGDTTGLDALFNAQPLFADASAATVGFTLDGSGWTSRMRVIGSDHNDMLRTGTGNDRVAGHAGNDKIAGMQGNDILSGNDGRDMIQGGAGADRISGGAGKDQLAGGAGNDILLGGKQADRIAGGAGKDALDGGTGNDTLTGQGGADKITGGRGDDLMTGGKGADTFVFHAGFGNDTITKFHDGADLLDVHTLGITLASFSTDVVISSTSGGDTLIEMAGGSVTLQGVDSALIDSGDFIF